MPQQIREGFIVDEDEEDGGGDSDERERRRRRKRRRAEREQEEVLDEEDLDLIGENNPEFQRREPTQVCAPIFEVLRAQACPNTSAL